MPAPDSSRALVSQWTDAWLLAGVRTPFIDYTQAFALVSPIDLGIKAAREVFARSGLPPADVGTVIASSMAQTSLRRISAAPAHRRVCRRADGSAGPPGAASVRVWHRDHRTGRGYAACSGAHRSRSASVRNR